MIKRILLLLPLLPACLASIYAQWGKEVSIPELKKQLNHTAPDTTTARLMLKLALLYVYKPGENPVDLDSALLLSAQAVKLNAPFHNTFIQARSYFVNANALRERGDKVNAQIAIHKSISAFKTMPGCAGLGDAYMELANYYELGSRDGVLEKKKCYEQALSQFRLAGVREQQADALKNLGDINYLLRNYGEALLNLRETLAIYTAIGHKALQGVYDLMGIISTGIGDYANAVKYGLLAAKTAEELGDTTLQLCTIYNRLAVAYGNWFKRDDARVYLKKSLAIAMKYHDKDAIETVLLNLCYLQADRPGWQETLKLLQSADKSIGNRNLEDSMYLFVFYNITYCAGRQYEAARPYANKLVKMIPRLQNSLSLGALYSSVTHFYIETGQYALAEKYGDAALAFARKNSNKRTILLAYLFKARADSGMGNYVSALYNYQVYKNMSDSTFGESKSFQFAQMQVIYETEKKDKDLQFQQQANGLMKSKNQLQQMELERASLARNIIIIASLSLLALLFTGYQFKKRSNEKLRTKQQEINAQNNRLKESLAAQQKLLEEKEWLVKEIHHRVKNNLQIVISLLNAQSEFLDSPSALRAIRESRERMQAIAIIHQRLYQAENTTVIGMPSYISEMVGFLSSSFTDTWKIRFVQDIENIHLDVSQAVPLGLILNEAITNAVKYAFPGDRQGSIGILLHRTDKNRILLKIKDDGQGLPAGFDTGAGNSLGMQLIQLFSEQLEGELHISGNNGVEIALAFKQYGEEKKPILIKAAV